MEYVTGIGGVFFRAKDAEALGTWYWQHLGVNPAPSTYSERPWQQQAGPTVFTPMPNDSPHFRNATQQWSINFRVRDLDAMVTQLRDAGIAVTEHAQTYPNGKFAELEDPEGTPIQLWEPTEADAVE